VAALSAPISHHQLQLRVMCLLISFSFQPNYCQLSRYGPVYRPWKFTLNARCALLAFAHAFGFCFCLELRILL
jgi:hypothetical protein